MSDEEVKEPVKEEVHPIVQLLGGGITAITLYLKDKLPDEEFDFQELMDALFDGIGQSSQKVGTTLFVLSPEDQKILGMVHRIKRQYGPRTKMQLVVKPKSESGLVDAGGVPMTSKSGDDKPVIIKP